MISFKVNQKQFEKDMNNIVAYAQGFLDGAKRGKRKLFEVLGAQAVESLGDYIDATARMNPQSLFHVYEWYETGSSDARLFDLDYTISNVGLSIYGTFTQSTSVQEGSRDPFRKKAKYMEEAIPVTIRPKYVKFLKFEIRGRTIYSKGPIRVKNPGGEQTTGSFHETFKDYMQNYMSQALLDVSGISKSLRNPVGFKSNIAAGMRRGRSVGIRVGMNWISGEDV
jgi:hypothetical protein